MSKKQFNAREWLAVPQQEPHRAMAPSAMPLAVATESLKRAAAQKAAFASNSIDEDIETVVGRVEEAHVDIAPDYADWRNLGFALADALGEVGRSYFHRLSRFYPGYTAKETDKQYTACVSAHGHGVKVNTFFHLAKQAGVSLAKKRDAKMSKMSKMSIMSKMSTDNLKISGKSETGNEANIYMVNENSLQEVKVDVNTGAVVDVKAASTDNHLAAALNVGSAAEVEADSESGGDDQAMNEPLSTIIRTSAVEKGEEEDGIAIEQLPTLLRQVVAQNNSAEDADLLLLGALTVISACLPNIYGIYAQREVFPNLFLFVTAPASAGKGRLTLCRRLVEPIHRDLRQQSKLEQAEYERLQNEYNESKNKSELEIPVEPPLRALFVPANSSATAVFQVLNDNDGVGLMFETEGDTLTQTFNSEHGNYSDGFRKAFHHETISYHRRKDREFVELELPRLSAVLSGTPNQVRRLIPDTENGLFSRFMFYYIQTRLVWNDVFANSDSETLDIYFKRLGLQFYELYKSLKASDAIRFHMTKKQQREFNIFFDGIQREYSDLFGLDIVASVRRLGVITFRIIMILSALRIMDNGELPKVLTCCDDDFKSAKRILTVLLQHMVRVYGMMPKSHAEKPVVQVGKAMLVQRYYDLLPEKFDTPESLTVASSLAISASSSYRYILSFIKKGMLYRVSHGQYSKISK